MNRILYVGIRRCSGKNLEELGKYREVPVRLAELEKQVDKISKDIDQIAVTFKKHEEVLKNVVFNQFSTLVGFGVFTFGLCIATSRL